MPVWAFVSVGKKIVSVDVSLAECPSIAEVASLMTDTTSALIAAKKIFEVVDRQPVIESNSPSSARPSSVTGDILFNDVLFLSLLSHSLLIHTFFHYFIHNFLLHTPLSRYTSRTRLDLTSLFFVAST